jgi:hypothetical protein
MRSLVLLSVAAMSLAGCSSGPAKTDSPFSQPNQLMGEEIRNRIASIPYQHRGELFDNLLWLAQTGEPAIPALLEGLRNNEPKVRANCAYVLGRIGDRRTIGDLNGIAKDRHDVVRMEVARALVLMGDVKHSPALIAGLDSEKPQVRYYCHEALKAATGRDYGYDHLTENEQQRKTAVLGWRRWWSEQSGDPWFAKKYAAENGMNPDGTPLLPAEVATPPQPSVEIDPPAVEMPEEQDPGKPETKPASQPSSKPSKGDTPPAPSRWR